MSLRSGPRASASAVRSSRRGVESSRSTSGGQLRRPGADVALGGPSRGRCEVTEVQGMVLSDMKNWVPSSPHTSWRHWPSAELLGRGPRFGACDYGDDLAAWLNSYVDSSRPTPLGTHPGSSGPIADAEIFLVRPHRGVVRCNSLGCGCTSPTCPTRPAEWRHGVAPFDNPTWTEGVIK